MKYIVCFLRLPPMQVARQNESEHNYHCFKNKFEIGEKNGNTKIIKR